MAMESELIRWLFAQGVLGGVCVFLIWMYLRSDGRYVEGQKLYIDLLAKSIESDNKVTAALNASTEAMKTAIALLQTTRGG